jgi:hypothetical protein
LYSITYFAFSFSEIIQSASDTNLYFSETETETNNTGRKERPGCIFSVCSTAGTHGKKIQNMHIRALELAMRHEEEYLGLCVNYQFNPNAN